MNVRWIVAPILVLCIVAFVTSQARYAEAETVRNFTLYGDYTAGWGFSADNITSPGPTITVDLNDVVNLTLVNLNTESWAAHRFLLSYENSSTPQSGDALSPQIGPGETIIFTFTANVSGTFTYYCTHHTSPMYGTFIVIPPIPEFQPLILLAVLTACTLTVVLVCRRTRRP
jgi:FtsP/CotA-like multicopper oxidase with cupredoxin domain